MNISSVTDFPIIKSQMDALGFDSWTELDPTNHSSPLSLILSWLFKRIRRYTGNESPLCVIITAVIV